MIKKYIIRYDTNNVIKTMKVETKEEKDNITDMIEKLGYEYIVIASKEDRESDFTIGVMLDFEEYNLKK